MIGINSAISRQASNIGFAVPINQARAILPQLKKPGRVSRGYIGVALRDVDPDLQASLRLTRSDGALVQDVTAGSPGARAGLKPYDLIVSVDGETVRTNDALIREIAARAPGSTARLELLRDGRAAGGDGEAGRAAGARARATAPPIRRPSARRSGSARASSGLTLIEIDESNAHRFDVPAGMTGLLVQRVEPLQRRLRRRHRARRRSSSRSTASRSTRSPASAASSARPGRASCWPSSSTIPTSTSATIHTVRTATR